MQKKATLLFANHHSIDRMSNMEGHGVPPSEDGGGESTGNGEKLGEKPFALLFGETYDFSGG